MTSSAPPVLSLEECAFQFGQTYDSYLAIDPGRKTFWSTDRTGVFSYMADGRYVHASGGLLSEGANRPALLDEALAWAASDRKQLSFYNVTPDDLPLFRDRGFQATRWGDDLIIPLTDWSWGGKAFEWVRRQTNFVRRHGMTFEECGLDELSPEDRLALVAEIVGVSRLALARRPQVREIGFLNGSFDPENLGRRRLFVARSTEEGGRIDGFLLCNPARGGTEWSLETYQQRPDALRGTIPYLMHQALLKLQAEGVERASLCVVPAMRLGDLQPGESRLVRGMLAASRFTGFLFDAVGMQHFKSRFRPLTEPRYLCVSPAATIGSVWSFIRISGALHLSPLKVLQRIGRRRGAALPVERASGFQPVLPPVLPAVEVR
jgi:phosphatidylglycerol lysyltransferase